VTDRVSKKDRKKLALAARDNRFMKRFLIAVLVGVCAGMFIHQQAVRPATPVGYRAVLNEYIRRHNMPDRAWLTGREDIGQEIVALQSFTTRLGGLLDRYKDVSPLSRRIHGEFRQFRVSKFTNGVSYDPMPPPPDGNIEAMMLSHMMMLEVCILPPAQRNHPMLLPNSMYYYQQWQAVMVDSLEWTDEFLAAIAYHEFGHALRHRIDRAPSSTAAGNSDLWISEEVEMHELEMHVLDASVQGRFNPLLDNIIARVGDRGASPETYQELADAITIEDWQAFDALFGIQPAGPRTNSLHAAQFVISLGFRFIERTGSPADRRALQTGYYRFVMGHLAQR
jgi:hypothetical protein